MKRRQFLGRSFWLGGGLIALGNKMLAFDGKKTIRGRVTGGGRRLKAVVISDGYNLVATDSEGRYEIEPHPLARHLFVCTPAGYAFLQENSIARHYTTLDAVRKKKTWDIELSPLPKDDHQHQFIIWADPQVKNEKDVKKMMEQSVPDVKKWAGSSAEPALLHGITVGDIVWDTPELFPEYNKAVGEMGIPFFQCLGNHDMDYEQGGDESSDRSFQKMYGPSWYSFNRGKAHYVILDDVRYLGKGREYDGYISKAQLDWLAKDLEFVPKENLIILCVHIPVHNGVKNNKDLYAVLGQRNVHIMSGHTHYHRNVIQGNIFEHNHGTVCGAWWTGPICGDGTPNGYGVYEVDGTELRWRYQATGKKENYQMKAFVNDLDESHKQLLINIWNHDPAWSTELIADGTPLGSLEQITAFDPDAYDTLLGPEKPKSRGFAEPRKTEHLFQKKIPASTRELIVKATDRFGKQFTLTKKL